MDNEVKAKMDEFLKTYGRRELSLEEADKVSDGVVEGLTDIYGTYRTGGEIIDLGRAMAKNFGYDIAGVAICELFQLNPNEATRIKGEGSDVDKMDCLLAEMFKIYERLDKSGRSFWSL